MVVGLMVGGVVCVFTRVKYVGSVQRELQYNSIVELNNSSKIPTRD